MLNTQPHMLKTMPFQPFSKYDFIESFIKKGGDKAQAEIIAEAIKNNQQNNIENLAHKEDLLELAKASKRDLLELAKASKRDLLELEKNNKRDLLELEERLLKELKLMQLHNDEKFKMIEMKMKAMEMKMTIKLGVMTTAIVGFFSVLPNIF